MFFKAHFKAKFSGNWKDQPRDVVKNNFITFIKNEYENCHVFLTDIGEPSMEKHIEKKLAIRGNEVVENQLVSNRVTGLEVNGFLNIEADNLGDAFDVVKLAVAGKNRSWATELLSVDIDPIKEDKMPGAIYWKLLKCSAGNKVAEPVERSYRI